VLPAPGLQFSGASLPLTEKSYQLRMCGCWVQRVYEAAITTTTARIATTACRRGRSSAPGMSSRTMNRPGLAVVLPPWELNLRAERKSPAIVMEV
jgi:hypothetical protein